MTSKTKVGVAVVALVVALGFATACGSSSTSSSTSNGSTQGSGTPNPSYVTWCTSVQNLVDQASPADLSDLGALAAFNSSVASLATTAPEPIQADMQTLSTATEAKLTAVQQDPTATLPQALADSSTAAVQEITTFVSQNCGFQLPPIKL